MQLTATWHMTVVFWANLTVQTSIEAMEWYYGVYYFPQLAHTLEYILKDLFICIIKEQCSDEGESTWRWYKGCQNNINDIVCQIQWEQIVDTPMAKLASTEGQQFWILHRAESEWQLVVPIHKCGIGWLHRQNRDRHAPYPILTICVNTTSMKFGLVSQLNHKRFGRYYT